MMGWAEKLNKQDKIFIAGHRGMVGSATVRCLKRNRFINIIMRTSKELDLRRQADVEEYFAYVRPDYVLMAAARVGGILANNTYRAQFIYENLMIQNNIIHAAYEQEVKKLLFLGSSCIYPKNCPQPIKEEYLLTGELESTNEPFAIAKIAGIKMCENYYKQYGCNFYSIMPANMYGQYDKYDLETSHVLSALLRKFHEAKVNKKKVVTLWGTGKPLREFLYVEDMAEACVYLMERVNANDIFNQSITHLNIGTGEEISIVELSRLVSKVVGFTGSIEFNNSKPDGMPRKLLDSCRLNNLGWNSKTPIQKGVEMTYNWCIKNNRFLDWV